MIVKSERFWNSLQNLTLHCWLFIIIIIIEFIDCDLQKFFNLICEYLLLDIFLFGSWWSDHHQWEQLLLEKFDHQRRYWETIPIHIHIPIDEDGEEKGAGIATFDLWLQVPTQLCNLSSEAGSWMAGGRQKRRSKRYSVCSGMVTLCHWPFSLEIQTKIVLI